MKRLENGKFIGRCIDCPYREYVQRREWCGYSGHMIGNVEEMPLWCELEDKEIENGETANQRKTAD